MRLRGLSESMVPAPGECSRNKRGSQSEMSGTSIYTEVCVCVCVCEEGAKV